MLGITAGMRYVKSRVRFKHFYGWDMARGRLFHFPTTRVPRRRDYVKINELPARVAELADAPDLGSGSERSAGSIPVPSMCSILQGEENAA